MRSVISLRVVVGGRGFVSRLISKLYIILRKMPFAQPHFVSDLLEALLNEVLWLRYIGC